MRAGGTVRETGQQVRELITRAQDAVAGARWLEALDFASQALAADPHQSEAAVLVGTARQRLGAIGAPTAELRQVSVLAIDMERSTAIAAQVGPEKMRELMMAVYEACAEAVARYEGRVTKYSGDGVLAQFGHPIAHEDDARRAVLAAMAVLEHIDDNSPHWEAQYGTPVQIRAGIDSGVAAVGPVDASPWSPEELAGDPPNVATRVQNTADPMTIRVTDATHKLIEGWFETERVGEVELRNYPRPIGLHVVVRPTDAETRLEARVRARPSLVNRDEELAVMRAAWNRVAGGDRQLLSITGEAGIGKSRLVEHIVATAVATGAAQLTLACTQLHRESPLRPVARALSRFFRVFPQEGGSDALWLDAIRTRLEQLPGLRLPADRLVPIYGWLLGIRSAVDLEPEELRRQSFGAVIDLLEAMAKSSTLVLAIEDADTADPSTVALIRALLDRPALPMLVMLTSREGVAWLEAPDHTVELSTLHTVDAAELVRSLAPDLEPDAVDRLAQRSDGVPFFAEELALAAGEAPLTGALAETFELSGFLAARIDELGPDLKHLVGLIAVAGQEIRLDVLERVAQLPSTELGRRVGQLLESRVVVRGGAALGGGVVRFRHGLMRSVAYGTLLETRRAELHGRIAEVLSELPAGVAAPEDLANHFELAGQRDRAAPRWLEAGQLASAAGAYTEATELFAHCLRALATLPTGPEVLRMELEAQLGQGTALSAIAGYTSQEARSAFERSVTLAERLENTIAIMPALWGAWAYWFVLGEHGVASALAERCVRISTEAPHQVGLRLLAAAINGYQLLYTGDFERALSELDWTTRLSDVAPPDVFPHDPVTVGVASRAVVLWFLGQEEAARTLAIDARERVQALDPEARRTALTQTFALSLLAWLAELDGDPYTAIEVAEQAAGIATEHSYPTWVAAATMHRSIALCSLERYDEGLPTLAAVLAGWRTAGQDSSGRQLHPVLMTPYFAGRLAEAQLATGAVEEASSELDRLLTDTRSNGERFWDVELLRLRACAAERMGAPREEVSTHMEAARRLAEEQHANGLLLRLTRRKELER
jgi:class 3 adenylate cyclase/tetratricopeptide (TPR) repeat protein